MDIFPIDLSSIPLDSDIDFATNIEVGAKPVSISPNKISLAELNKLKD